MEPKRLYRSHNSIIAGVCGGLGDYFNIDPVLVRAIFVLLSCIGGSGLLLYIILWIIIPRASYTSYQNQTTTPPNNETSYQPNSPAPETPTSSGQMSAFIIGILFILFGLLVLMRRFFHIGFINFWPFALITIGIVLIVSYLKNNPKK